MHLCYIDESGTFDVPGATSHYVLAGISVSDQDWKRFNAELEALRDKYGLAEAEIHVAWMLRPYVEQQGIPNFESMLPERRRREVLAKRTGELYRLRKGRRDTLKLVQRNYKKTEAYVHLALEERRRLVSEIARLVASWETVRLFAECVDKVHFDPVLTGRSIQEQAFEQIVSRFERYLSNIGAGHGLLVHDNNQTVAARHTALMKSFLTEGTLWTHIDHVIETPMFVDSQLTGMVQLADLCAYALRRYLESGEEHLFDLVMRRADRSHGASVGVRHFTSSGCTCKICLAH